jgi:hypothetical protein
MPLRGTAPKHEPPKSPIFLWETKLLYPAMSMVATFGSDRFKQMIFTRQLYKRTGSIGDCAMPAMSLFGTG